MTVEFVCYKESRSVFWFRHVLHRLVDKLKRRRVFPRGPRLCAFPNDLIGRELAVAGAYEPAGISAIEWLCDKGVIDLNPGATFLDIGANIGVYAVSLAGRFPSVFAFEPHPITSQILGLNVALNGLGNVSMQPYALSDQDGVADLIDMSHDNVGASTLEPARACGGTHRVELRHAGAAVRALTKSRVALIKLDVEGHELKVLSGLKELLKEQRPVVAFEANDAALAQSVPALLREVGYTTFVALDYSPVVRSLLFRVILLTLRGVKYSLRTVESLEGRQCSLVFAFDEEASARYNSAMRLTGKS